MSLKDRVYAALWKRFRETTRKSHDEKGYVLDWKHNLPPGVNPELIRPDFQKGRGNELKRKILAIHSSSALAANTFGRWKTEPHLLTCGRAGGFKAPDLEWRPSTWFNDRPPNLDVLLESESRRIGIESKLTEPLSRKRPKISEKYQRSHFTKCDDAWWSLLEEYRTGELSHFDIAQIIKHALGLANVATKAKPSHLVYLYWEPVNANDFDVYRNHKADLDRVVARTKGACVELTGMTYADLWNEWNQIPALQEHVRRLRERYEVSV